MCPEVLNRQRDRIIPNQMEKPTKALACFRVALMTAEATRKLEYGESHCGITRDSGGGGGLLPFSVNNRRQEGPRSASNAGTDDFRWIHFREPPESNPYERESIGCGSTTNSLGTPNSILSCIEPEWSNQATSLEYANNRRSLGG